MDRRNFIKTSVALPAAAALPWTEAIAADAAWRTFEITTRVQMLKPKGVARAWLPLPMMDDSDWHRSGASESSGNAVRTQICRDGKYGAGMLYADWSPDQASPVVELTSRFATRDRHQAFG